MHHGDGVLLRRAAEIFHRRIVLEVIRQLGDQVAQRLARVVDLAVLVGVQPGAAGIADVLLALRHLLHGGRQRPARAEQVGLKDQQVGGVLLVQHVIERRIGGDAAVPVIVAVDLDRRESRRQRARRHDMLGPDLLLRIVEIDEVAGGDIHRADAEPRRLRIDAVEIHQPLQRRAQRRGVVIAQRLRQVRRPELRRWKARREETGHAERGDRHRAAFVIERTRHVARQVGLPGQRRRDEIPERLELFEPLLARIAGDDRGVDRADRDAGDPGRLEIVPAQRLIGAGLIRPQRAAALQHQHALRLGRGGGAGSMRWCHGEPAGDGIEVYGTSPHRGVGSPLRQCNKG